MSAVEVPTELRLRFEASEWELAWSHVPELQTWRLTAINGEVSYLKLIGRDWEVRGESEAERLGWAGEHLPVPEVLASGTVDGVDWILTRGLPGRNAIDPEFMAEPRRLAGVLGRGLRRFHEVPTEGCPFDFRNDAALERLRQKASTDEVSTLIALRPQTEDLVVTHGDACLPNFLIDEWDVSGYVDLGDLGVADRWRDIAVCLWSLGHNLGSGWDEEFLDGYGIERDKRKTAFYQGLYFAL